MSDFTEEQLNEMLKWERSQAVSDVMKKNLATLLFEHEPKWWKGLDERQRKEVNFAMIYTQYFGHGTAGHTQYVLIAKLASLLDEFEGLISGVEK